VRFRSPAAGWRRPAAAVACRATEGIQYVEHLKGDGDEVFEAACKLRLEGIVSKRLTAPYKSGPCKSWLKARNSKSSAYLRIIDGTF
jgi:bifunctional non-homologous end joining protein LigD